MYRRSFLRVLLLLLGAFSSPLIASQIDGMTLKVGRGAAGNVTLDWTGGQPTFSVYRSATRQAVVPPPGDLIGTPDVRTFDDAPPAGAIFYYEIASPCDYAPPEICDGMDNDCNGVVDGPGSESACSLPNAMPQCLNGSCAIAGCLAGFNDCDTSPADGCETNNHVPQSTSPAFYGGPTNADLKAGYTRVSAITNCGGCGVSCDDADPCSTDLCVPAGPGGSEVGMCRHYGRAQCSESRCDGALNPPGTPPPLEPACMGADADGDGLPAQWETAQTDPYLNSMNQAAGVDLNCDGEISGAGGDLIWHEPPSGDGSKDLYLELDYMPGTGFIADPILGVIPEPFDHSPPVHPTTGVSAVEEVRIAFARQGIALHVDLSAQALPHAQLMFLPTSQASFCASAVDPVTGEPIRSFYEYKGSPANHDSRRRIGYHYLISGHTSCVDSQFADTDGSGTAEINGNDGIVSMGGYRYYSVAPSGTSCTSNSDCCPGCPSNPYTCVQSGVCVSLADRVRRHLEWAGTLMHELGHNLGLCHGGAGDPTSSSPCDSASTNYAPNHISSMNYMFQFAWIFRSATAGTISPPDPALPRRIDFSYGVEPVLLDESRLDESLGLGVNVAPFDRDITRYVCPNQTRAAPSSGPIDWDCDGTISPFPVSADINGDGIIGVLTSSDDWGNLRFDFQCQPHFEN